jgi:hypothetical protein
MYRIAKMLGVSSWDVYGLDKGRAGPKTAARLFDLLIGLVRGSS